MDEIIPVCRVCHVPLGQMHGFTRYHLAVTDHDEVDGVGHHWLDGWADICYLMGGTFGVVAMSDCLV